MNKDNYFNIPTSERDGFIYRIIRVQRLFELFDIKQNVLVKPKKWDDPFENFILRSQQVYGQCWTLQSASDALWRIYSPKLDAVRIRSTVRLLAESLHQTRGRLAHVETFIGRVLYLRNESLMTFAQNVSKKAAAASAKILAKTLLVKRPAFKHEREVRLLFVPHDKSHVEHDVFHYPINPEEMIDQIMIDPRMSKQDADSLREKIKAKTGFRGAIKRSLLYAPPPNFLEDTV